jgi:integration host factor subunit beta
MNPNLIQYIQSSTGFQENTIKLVLESFKTYVHLQLAQKFLLPLKDFGLFSVKFVKPRKGRNPRTGEEIDIPGKYKPTFKFTGGFSVPDQPLENVPNTLKQATKEWLVKIGNETKAIAENLLLDYSISKNTPIWTETNGWVLAGEIQELEYLF